jgi:hypothetical protein
MKFFTTSTGAPQTVMFSRGKTGFGGSIAITFNQILIQFYIVPPYGIPYQLKFGKIILMDNLRKS